MTFCNRSSLVVYPANHLTPEVIDLVFGSNNEILFQYLEQDSTGNIIAWIKLRSSQLVDEYISMYNKKELLGKIIHVVTSDFYIKNHGIDREKQTSSDEEADNSDYSDTPIKPKILDNIIKEKTPYKIPHYESSDSTDSSHESSRKHEHSRHHKRRHHSNRHKHSRHRH